MTRVLACTRLLAALFLGSAAAGSAVSGGCAQKLAQRSPDDLNDPAAAARASAMTAASAAVTASLVSSSGHWGDVPAQPTDLASPSGESSPALATFDHVTLRALEAQGFGFESMALGLVQRDGAIRDNAELQQDPGYAFIAKTLPTDLDELVAADNRAGVGMRFAHRVFDKRWLVSPKFHYELVAIVHRVDRRAFAPTTCGELRMVYRLAYKSRVGAHAVASRVPMTVNVVRYINDAGCQRWVAAINRVKDGDQREAAAQWMADGAPLSARMLALTSFKSVEVNLQSVRWPSTVRPNMAGHAEYLMRVFQRAQATAAFHVATLENTPDVSRLNRDTKLRQKLAEWLTAPAQNHDIIQGTVRIPDEFLATRVMSFAPHGLARKGNRPYTALFAVSWADRTSAPEILRRLDGLSCPGCHQSRSVAGFHILGNEGADKQADGLAVPHSPHFTDEMPRRHNYVAALSQGMTPDEYRPPAEHPAASGGWGSRCGLDTTPSASFAQWTCSEGLVCRAIDDPLVGECVPSEAQIGDACEWGSANWDEPGRDRIRLGPVSACGPDRVCERNAVGFPGGMCSGGCDGAPNGVSVCGSIAVLDSFNACLAHGEVFETCLATTTRPGALRRCSHQLPCRDDYVCAAMPGGDGACLPPYFLFQLRVDGHVIE